jgi:hypothetical protein
MRWKRLPHECPEPGCYWFRYRPGESLTLMRGYKLGTDTGCQEMLEIENRKKIWCGETCLDWGLMKEYFDAMAPLSLRLEDEVTK